MLCYFCEKQLETTWWGENNRPQKIECERCGTIKFADGVADLIENEQFTKEDKRTLSIILRNNFERNYKRPVGELYDINWMHKAINQYSSLNPIEKMDNALLILDKTTKTTGQIIKIPVEVDFPYYHCIDSDELKSILRLIEEQEYIIQISGEPEKEGLWITAKGYEKLSELKKSRIDSRRCFVGMWFNTEMLTVFKQAIQPAIEFIEEGASEPQFRAVRVDNVEHVNDINDEIIAQIRRSRFIVCDLTGYRGGVYFEAGFAYGLGMPVIYTCRKDWCDEDSLLDNAGNIVESLKDSNGRQVQVKKEGVHFDLAHRNRIEWEIDKLDDFKVKLENRH